MSAIILSMIEHLGKCQVSARTLRDFDGTIPNVFVSMNAASAQGGAIFIRGIGYPGTEKTQSPGVGTIVDGVQVDSNTGYTYSTPYHLS